MNENLLGYGFAVNNHVPLVLTFHLSVITFAGCPSILVQFATRIYEYEKLSGNSGTPFVTIIGIYYL